MSERENDGFVTLRLPDHLREKIEKLADLNDRSRSAEIRVAIEQYVEKASA